MIPLLPTLHLQALLLLLMPQTIEFQLPHPLTLTVTIESEGAPGPQIDTDCVTLMQSYNLAADQADPYERTTQAEFDLGHFCSVGATIPLRQ